MNRKFLQIVTMLFAATLVTLGRKCICNNCDTAVFHQPLVKIVHSAKENLIIAESILHELNATFLRERIHSSVYPRVECALMTLPTPKNEIDNVRTITSLTEDYDVLLTTVTIIGEIKATNDNNSYTSLLHNLEERVYNVICSLNKVLQHYGVNIDRHTVRDSVVSLCAASSIEERYLRDFTLLQGISDILRPLKNKYRILFRTFHNN